MIEGYLLALATGSSLDANTHNVSLFNLVENLTVPAEALDEIVPVELHFHCRLAPEARGRKFELRIVRTGEDGVQTPGDPLPFQTTDSPRFRLRATFFRMPAEYGDYVLHAEWRPAGEPLWHRDGAAWPLSVRAAPEGGPGA